MKKQQPNGFGQMYKKDGSLFVGMFENGNATGIGCYFLKDGTYFKGKIENNMINDPNAYIEKVDDQGKIVYEGEVKNNELEGHGK